jgi:hypothetical protein
MKSTFAKFAKFAKYDKMLERKFASKPCSCASKLLGQNLGKMTDIAAVVEKLSDPVPSLETEKSPESGKDGRKKPRTEKQKASTARMMEKRHQGKLELNENYNPDNIAIAELWYSNHEMAKETRRKRKMDDMEKLISKRLDTYHQQLMEDMQKPLSGFLDRYIDEYLEDIPEDKPNKPTQNVETRSRSPTPEFKAPPKRSSKTQLLRPGERESIDFRRFF